MYKGFAVKQPGYSHKEKEIPCQDAAAYELGDSYAIAAASDGHGGEKYFRSDVGSDIAVTVALRCLKDFIEKREEESLTLYELNHLASRIIAAWHGEIEKHFTESPLTEKEKEICDKYGISADVFQTSFYGATLLYACMTPDHCFASQIGDGASVFLKPDGVVETPVATDARLGFGLTTSLCDFDAAGNFRHFFAAAEDFAAIFLCTDGVVDSYDHASFLRFNRTIFEAMNENEAFAKEQLAAWLPTLSERGSQDDVTMAGVYQSLMPGVTVLSHDDNDD